MPNLVGEFVVIKTSQESHETGNIYRRKGNAC